LPEVQATCEKVIIIHQGQIVAQDRIENLAKMEQGQTHVAIRVRRDLELSKLVQDLDGVLAVHPGATARDWELDIRGQDEVLEKLTERLVTSGAGLLEITPRRRDLEDVFLKLTYGRGGN